MMDVKCAERDERNASVIDSSKSPYLPPQEERGKPLGPSLREVRRRIGASLTRRLGRVPVALNHR